MSVNNRFTICYFQRNSVQADEWKYAKQNKYGIKIVKTVKLDISIYKSQAVSLLVDRKH
jgi:hypothetical protein